METTINARNSVQEAFKDILKKSADFAHELKRFGYETLAAVRGGEITATGRRLRRVKKSSSSTFAFLVGSDSLPTQLALAFQSTISSQNAAAEGHRQFNRYSPVTRSPDAKTVNAEFRSVSTPRTVFKQLEKDQLNFEQNVEAIQKEHDQSGLIGPSADLFTAFENSSKTHGLQVTAFDAGKPVGYAHCATKVESLTKDFEANNNFFKRLFEPKELVQVYGHVATPQTVVSIQPDAPRATNQPCYVHP